jgi:hypothetical protein
MIYDVPGRSEPVIEARCDSSIQLPSGSRTIETRAVVPSVTGAGLAATMISGAGVGENAVHGGPFR